VLGFDADHRAVAGRTRLEGIFRAHPDPDGSWSASGTATSSWEPERSTPWVNLGASWAGRHGFIGGGRVHGADVARVRARFVNSVEVEDSIDHGSALLVTEEAIALPAAIALLDRHGSVIARQDWPEGWDELQAPTARFRRPT